MAAARRKNGAADDAKGNWSQQRLAQRLVTNAHPLHTEETTDEHHGHTHSNTKASAQLNRVSGGAPSVDSRARCRVPAPTVGAVARGGVQLFAVPFASAMSDCDLELLARLLDLSTHMNPKMRPSPNSPGVARLDYFSGLFLIRGADEGQWVFEARTWGHPATQTVHEWHLLAADAAHRLDPSVIRPKRLIARSPESSTHAPGRAANKRFGRIRRRLVGLR